MTRIAFLFIFIFCSVTFSFAQESIKVMYYNLLKFPQTAPDRADTLKNIIQHAQPDIFVVNELFSSFGAGLIMQKALNVDGVTHYSQAVFQGANGTDTDNHLFYNHNKIAFKEQHNINANTRAISEYILYYKDPNLAQTNDTTFLYVYGCHLKAGTASDVSSSGLTNGERRASAVLSFKNYLTNHNRTNNIIVGGDMNTYSSNEEAYSNFISAGTMNLIDPIGQTGNWNNSYTHRTVHTQSTREYGGVSYAGGSTGGMDDRFDMIFVSNDIMNGSQGAKYVTNSYKAVGQDGNKFNKSVNYGTNTAVPQDVANSLFYMSDHLPVLLELEVGGPVNVQQNEDVISRFNFDANTKLMSLDLSNTFNSVDLSIFSLSGQQIISQKYSNTAVVSNYYSQLSPGIYVARIIADNQPVTVKFLVY